MSPETIGKAARSSCRCLKSRKLDNVYDLYQNTKHESMQRGEFTLEPNQFVPFEDRVRVIWSREIPDG